MEYVFTGLCVCVLTYGHAYVHAGGSPELMSRASYHHSHGFQGGRVSQENLEPAATAVWLIPSLFLSSPELTGRLPCLPGVHMGSDDQNSSPQAWAAAALIMEPFGSL